MADSQRRLNCYLSKITSHGEIHVTENQQCNRFTTMHGEQELNDGADINPTKMCY